MVMIAIERLHNLIRVVENIPPNKFNIKSYCGCAIGHALQDPWFISQGLKHLLYGPIPIYQGKEGREAICQFFSITYEQADIFYASDYMIERYVEIPIVTPQMFLAKLRVLLLEKQAQALEFMREIVAAPGEPPEGTFGSFEEMMACLNDKCKGVNYFH